MHSYKILNVDESTGTFVVDFEGIGPVNYFIPRDEHNYLSGDLLEQAIQAMYPEHAKLERDLIQSIGGIDNIKAMIDPEALARRQEEEERLAEFTRLKLEAEEEERRQKEYFESDAGRQEAARNQRNDLLLRTDWTQVPDAPLTAAEVAAFAQYRQALRDLPSVEGFPNVDWPVPPEV